MKIRDTLRIECFLEAINDYADIKRQHDKEREAYTGYSWGYYGRFYIEQMNKAAAEVEDQLIKWLNDREGK